GQLQPLAPVHVCRRWWARPDERTGRIWFRRKVVRGHAEAAAVRQHAFGAGCHHFTSNQRFEVFGLLRGSPVSPTNTFRTFHLLGLSGTWISALVTRSDSPMKARPHGESNNGLEIRRISLPAGSRTAIWLGPIRPT